MCSERAAPSAPEYMFLVGLGNPGLDYTDTRHNVGYRVVERIWEAHAEASLMRNAGVEYRIGGAEDGDAERGSAGGRRVIVARSRTYMNLSGPPIRNLLDTFDGAPERLLLIHDDLDLPIGVMRFRRRGSSGGHRGVESVIRALGDVEAGNEDFARLKIGVGRPGGAGGDVVDFVLGPPPDEERALQAEIESTAARAAWLWVTEGIECCMNTFHSKQTQAEEGEV